MTKEATARGMPIQKLYGRDTVLVDLQHRVLSSKNVCLLIRGPSGIGKTALTIRLQSNLRRIDHGYPCLRYEIASAAHPFEQALSRLTASLLEQIALPEESADIFRKAVTAFTWDHAKAVATSALLDLAHRFLPHSTETIKSLTKAISEVCSDSSLKATADRMARAGSEDFLSGFLCILEALSNAGIPGAVIVDRLEVAEEKVLQATKSLIYYVPDSWAVIVAVNDEKQEGIEVISSLWPDMAYIGADELRIQPLQIPDLEEWATDAGRAVQSYDEMREVLDNCGGRPLFLKDWILGTSSEAVKQRVTDSIGAYYEQRIRRLSQESRRLLTCLVLLPTQGLIPFDLCLSILGGQDSLSVHHTLDELVRHNLLEQCPVRPDSFHFVHELVPYCIFGLLPTQVRKDAAETLIRAIAELQPDSELASDRYTKLVLSELAGDTNLVLDLALPTAEGLVHSGAYALADRTYELCSRVASAVSNTELFAHAGIGRATVALDMGFYSQALLRLDAFSDISLPTAIRAEVAYKKGVASLRLNHYDDAKRQLEIAYDLFEKDNIIEGQIEAAKEQNVILRDLGRYDEAVALGRRLVERAKQHNVSGLVMASCYRALARSLALLGNRDSALEAGNTALELATKGGSIRSEGNAHLSIAEAHRHGRCAEEAVTHYMKALDIAKKAFNRDSALWSALGLSDTYLLCDDIATADAILDREVGRIVATAHDRYPLEHLHWQLSKATIAYLSGQMTITDLEAKAKQYEQLGITWPTRYVQNITTTRVFVPKLF